MIDRSTRRSLPCSSPRSKGSSRSPGRGTCDAQRYALSISQPALTARLQALEEELGAGLFRRTHSGMVLTPAGRAFLPHADRAIEAIRSGGSLVRELEQGVIGELALAVAPAVSAYVLPEILVRFTERHPNVRLLVRTGHSEEIVDLVARGQVELGIVRQLRDARVRSRPLFEDELVLVARPDHPFAMAGSGRRLGDQPRPAHPVRPDIELLRRDERPVPDCRRRPARRHGGRQHRGGQADGRARAWSRAASRDGGRRCAVRRLAPRDRARRYGDDPAADRGGRTARRRAPRGRSSRPCGALLERIPELIPRALPIVAGD